MSQESAPYDPRLPQPICAKPMRNTFHFWKFTVIGLAVFGFAGLMFIYDGFVRYPQQRERIAALEDDVKARQQAGAAEDDPALMALRKEQKELGNPKSDTDILLNRLIGIVCTPLGLFLLFRHFRNFRGEFLLENDVLALPDGKQVPIRSVTSADVSKWWNKGLAFYEYTTPEGAAGKFRLDALAYEPRPSDAIAFAIGEAIGQPLPAKPVKSDEPEPAESEPTAGA